MQRTVHTLIGVSGYGKTTLLRKLIGECNRALVFDALSNFHYGVVSSSQTEIRDYLLRINAKNEKAKFRIIYRPKIDLVERAQIAEAADWICMIARGVCNCDLFFDELDCFSSGDEMPKQLDLLVRFGRNIGISMHGAVRRPKVVIPRHWVTETTRWTVFQITDPLDSSFIEDSTGIERVRFNTLPYYHYISADKGIITTGTTELS